MVFGPFGFGDWPISTASIKNEVIKGKRPWQYLVKAYVENQQPFDVVETAKIAGVTPEQILKEANKHAMCFERYEMDEDGWTLLKCDNKVEERWSIDVHACGKLSKFLAWYKDYVKKTGWKGGSRVEA